MAYSGTVIDLIVLPAKLLKTLLFEITSIPRVMQNTMNRVLRMVTLA